jgi:soluble lytic murein transglycosylase-like protein
MIAIPEGIIKPHNAFRCDKWHIWHNSRLCVRIENLSLNAYLKRMLPGFSARRKGPSWITLAYITTCLAGVVCAGPLAEDSARFSQIWAGLQTSDSSRVLDDLNTLAGSDTGCAGQKARFYLAWRAHQRGQPGVVVNLISRGMPIELSDYALWLVADAYRKLDGPAAADSCLQSLAEDSTSVLGGDAIYQLAVRASETTRPQDVLALTERCRRLPSSPERRQEMELLAAQALAGLNRHAEAVERLWAAYADAPWTDEARSLREALKTYRRRYGFEPREETTAELARELSGLERLGDWAFGLQRIREESARTDSAERSVVLQFYRGRFHSGLGRHREAIPELQAVAHDSSHNPYRCEALYQLGRSAYLLDQDSLAIAALNEVAAQVEDSVLARKALDLLGTLHLDRGRPAQAVAAYQRRIELGEVGANAEGLWRLGWALWMADRPGDAAEIWGRLCAANGAVDYHAAAFYWRARALQKCGKTAESIQSLRELHARYPFSYYAVISSKPDSVQTVDRPLQVPALDELSATGDAHGRKFALLAAMRLSDAALLEWPAAASQQPDSDGFLWWKAQLHLWDGDALSAWLIVLGRLAVYIRSAGQRPPGFTELAYPLEFDSSIVRLSREKGLDPYLVLALICQESHFDPEAVSPVGAHGLMQLMPRTARAEAKRLGLHYSSSRLKNPAYNLRLGTAHLAELFADFNQDTLLVLAAYNAGVSAAQAWFEEFGERARDEFVELIPYRETRLFVKRNIEHRAAYRRLYPALNNRSQVSSASPEEPNGLPQR